MKFSIKDFSSKCDHIRSQLRIWSYLLKKSLMENFIFSQGTWNIFGRLLYYFPIIQKPIKFIEQFNLLPKKFWKVRFYYFT